MGRVWELIDAHRNSGPFKPPSLRDIAKAIGVSPSTPGNWRDSKSLPERRYVPAIAKFINKSEDVVYAAWLADAREQSQERVAESKARTRAEWDEALANRDNPPRNFRESLGLTIWDRENKRLYTTQEAYEAGILSVEEADELGLPVTEHEWAEAAKRGRREGDDQPGPETDDGS